MESIDMCFYYCCYKKNFFSSAPSLSLYSFSTAFCQQNFECLQHDHQVCFDAEVLYIKQVVYQLVIGTGVVFTCYLCQARDAWFYVVAIVIFRLLGNKLLNEEWSFRPGADDAHFAFQHIEQLR